MKLISHVTLRLSVAITVIMSVWAVLFYLAMIDEINDEVDDALEDYSETIIINSTIPFSTAPFCCSSVTSEGS